MFYADALITIACRARRGENLIIAHRSHLYQYLSNELKIPHWKVSLAYTLAQSVFALMALVSYKMGIIWQTIVFVFFMVMFMVAYRCIKGIKSKLLLS
jgi:Fuc2NAc and GlcNAc transferase